MGGGTASPEPEKSISVNKSILVDFLMGFTVGFVSTLDCGGAVPAFTSFVGAGLSIFGGIAACVAPKEYSEALFVVCVGAIEAAPLCI